MLNNFNYSKIFHLSLVFFLTLTIVGFFSITQVDTHHDGITLKPAVDVANGKMLFRDTFSQYGALTTLIHVLAIKLFGEYLIVIRLLTALFYGLIQILLWLIYSRVLPKWLNTFSCVIWLSLGYFFIDYPAMLVLPWATVYSIFSILLSLYFLILFLEKQNYILLFMTGMSSSAAFWFKINYGIISFLSILLILIILNINKKKLFSKFLLVFLSGYSIVHAIFFMWLAINNSLADFYLQTIKFAFVFSNNNKFSSNDFFAIKLIESLFQIGSKHKGVAAIWSILPIITVGILIYSIYNFIERKINLLSDEIILAISCVSFGLWFGYYPINALFHMYLSSVLFIGLFAYFLWKIIEVIIEKNIIYFKNKVIFAAIVILSLFLFQIYLNPIGITVVWSILPIITIGILIYSIYNFIGGKNLLSDKLILVISFASLMLWLDYYPINALNALFQIYLNSIFFIGLFASFLWRITEITGIERIRIFLGIHKIFIVAIIMLSILSQDLYFRINNVLDKISTIKKYDKIETPKFLKGMYVPKEEKQEYEIIEKLINKFSDYSLINLTNAGLYSLYKDNNDEFHKMNVNWKWNNSYLYSDYIAKLNKQLLLNSNIILSSDNLIIDGYIPIKLFPAPYATDLAEKLVFLVPGKSKNAFQICYIDNSKKRSNPSINNTLNENIYHIKLKLKESIITINSIIVETFTEYNIPANIEKYEFEYNIIPRIFNKEDEKLLKNLYLLNINTKQYSIPELKDNNTIHRLMDIFSNIFLYENYFIIADTFKNSRNGKIIIYLNDKLLHNKNDLFELNGLKNNIIDLIIPVSGISKNYIIKLRINYNGDYYYEEIIKNPK